MKKYARRYLPLFTFLFLFVACGTEQDDKSEKKKPNILLLVADDLGYADLGAYGGDIETPAIDGLAKEGIRFSRFHTAPLCAPTRAMLLSGNDNHIAGMGVQGRRTSVWGYEGNLSNRVAIIPEVLKSAGYHTYMAGKWHLGMDSISNPHSRGFEHSFVNLHGAGNHYDDQGIFQSTPTSLYTEDGQDVKWPKGAYSTNLFTDKLIEYIGRNHGDGSPFFAFAAYTSPHWPLQVDEKYWKKYEGRYDEGYEVLKSKRLESLKSSGLIPDHAVLPPNHERVTPWDSLPEMEQRIESRKMELYAGMVDNLDENIGRILQYLKEIGEYDNTLIVFMSDNGAAAEDFYHDEQYGPFIRQHFNVEYENMGNPTSFISYGPQWAEAGSAPFRYFKGEVTEGGMIAPMIMSGPGVNRINETFGGLVTLMDLAPTFYETGNASYPEDMNGNTLYPLKGTSLMEIVSSNATEVHGADYVYGLEHNGRAFVRKGKWKLVNNTPPFDVENFRLHDLSTDLVELMDVREAKPQVYQDMLGEWKKYASESKVKLPSPRE